jgi:hypothetical protein
VESGTARTVLPELDDQEVSPTSCLSPEGAIFARYQKAILRYTGTVVADSPENRATAIRCYDQGLTVQEAALLQAMTMVETTRAVARVGLKEAVDGLPPERLALMHEIWREGNAQSQQEGKEVGFQGSKVIMVLGAVFAVALAAWGVSVWMPGFSDVTEAPPVATATEAQQAPDPVKPVFFTDRTRMIEAQKVLKRTGLYQAKVDGIYGPGTKAALAAFQARHGLERTGKLDSVTFESLINPPGM